MPSDQVGEIAVHSPPRVIYLSSTESGREMLTILESLPCEIVMARVENQQADVFPPYDLGIGFLYTHRIPGSEFAIPYRWVNFHPGPLPEFRGRNLAYHAIMNGASEFGATLHYMDRDYDTGEIIEVVRFPLRSEYTAGDLVRLSHQALAGLFRKYVPRLLNGKVPSYCQPIGGVYYRKTVIDEAVELTEGQMRKIRAVTVPGRHYAAVTIGGRKYHVRPVAQR